MIFFKKSGKILWYQGIQGEKFLKIEVIVNFVLFFKVENVKVSIQVISEIFWYILMFFKLKDL